MGEAVDIGAAIFRILLNLFSNTFFSRVLGKELMEGMMMDMAKPNLVDYFPVLKILSLRRYTSPVGKFLELFYGFINERLDLRKSQNYQNTDVLDALITTSAHTPPTD